MRFGGNIEDYMVNITWKGIDITINSYVLRAFFILQAALLTPLLLVAIMEYVNNRGTYEPGAAYQPVTITYTNSIEERYMDAEGYQHTRYTNIFQYEVNGVSYSYTANNQVSGAVRGSQEIWYYNPNNPEQIGDSPSYEQASRSHKGLLYVYVVIQIIAIFVLIITCKFNKPEVNGGTWNRYSDARWDSVLREPDWYEPEEQKQDEQDVEAWDTEKEWGK